MLTKQDVAFRHYRKFNADGTVDPRGGITVAFTKEQGGDYGAAYCSTDDNFEYEYGRRLALERLNAGIDENGGPTSPQFAPSIRFVLLDAFVSEVVGGGYTHITRSKYRRSKKNEA